jgi:acyl-coenzyme A synthetase/AMP-(fatty) acid ligase
MISDHIDYHAQERPDGIALIVNGRAITYAEFSRDIRRFAGAMRAFALPHDAVVAVGCSDIYAHWLLLLAFERLGIATASINEQRLALFAQRCADMTLVVSQAHFHVGSPRRHQLITPEWLQDILALPPDDADSTFTSPDAPARITWTSGTTGAPKRLIFSHRLLAAWAAKWSWLWSLTHQSRYLVTMPFTVGGVYACAAGCLSAGATVVHDGRTTQAEALISRGITHTLLLPIHLRQILADLPQDCAKPARLTIATFGAPLSGTLRERATARIASEVCDMYGANEVDWIAATSRADVDGVKTLLPGVHAEVVDDHDAPVPKGAMGRLRVKTLRMVDGYPDDPGATRRMFKDGWFYPGDFAILLGGRRLKIVGRGDELLNVGGMKVSPATIEEKIRETVAARDIGVCSRRNQDGIEEICIAVSGAEIADEELVDRIKRALQGIQVGLFLILRLEQIPRNTTGKLLRDRLREVFEASYPISKKT